MKKICSLFMVLCMLLALVAVPAVTASAEEHITIGATDTEVTVYGVVYKVIRTADEFKAIAGNTNYILANNIDLDGYTVEGSNAALIKEWKGILDGNGYAVTNFKVSGNNAGLFQLYNGEGNVTFQNLSFGSETVPVQGAPTGNGSNGVVFGKFKGESVTFINCDSYVDMEEPTRAAMAAFVGQPDQAASSYTFIDCNAYGTISGRNKNAGFVGNVNQTDVEISFKNCVNNVNIKAGNQGNGGFVGHSTKAGVVISFIDCINNGKISLENQNEGDTPNIGGFVGQLNGEFTSCTFNKCENKGLVSSGTNVRSGMMIGLCSMKGDVIAKVLDASISTASWIGLMEDQTQSIKVEVISAEDKDTIATADDLKAIKKSGTFTVSANITLTEKVTLDVTGLDITLDFGGKTISGALEITGGGKLLITNGSLSNAGDALTVNGGANVTLEKMNVSGTITSTDNTNESTLTFKSGEFVASAGNCINWGGKGTLTVDGGLFTASGDNAALCQTNGKVVINNGIFKGKDAVKTDASATTTTAISLTINNGSFEGTRSAICFTGDKGDSFEIVVLGGSFKGTSDGALFTDSSDAKLVIEAGSFDEEIAAEYCKEYYVSVKNEETGVWEVKYHECDYEGVAWESLNTGSHKKACKVCGELVTKAHNFTKNVDNGNGTHSKICEDCGYKSTNGIKHNSSVEDCGDGTHKTTCEDCDLNVVEDHTWGDAKSIGDGKHEKTCTVCGAKTTEACVEKDGKCEACGVEITVEEKKGCGAAVTGGLFAVVTLLTVPALLIRKRKED